MTNTARKQGARVQIQHVLRNHWQLYLLVLPAIIYFFVLHYLPLYGIQIAFKDYKAVKDIAGNSWVGLKHFQHFFKAYDFERLITNTLLLNVLNLLFSFPVPLLLAVMLNQIRHQRTKRLIQTTIYVPYFISTIVLSGMLYIFLSPSSGILNMHEQPSACRLSTTCRKSPRSGPSILPPTSGRRPVILDDSELNLTASA